MIYILSYTWPQELSLKPYDALFLTFLNQVVVQIHSSYFRLLFWEQKIIVILNFNCPNHTGQNFQETLKSKHINYFYICCAIL